MENINPILDVSQKETQANPQEISQAENIQTPPVFAKRKKPLLIIILIILFIISLGTVGTLAYTNYLLKNSSYTKKDILVTTPTPPQTPIAVPTTITAITENWQTYERGKIISGLSINYPEGWIVKYRGSSYFIEFDLAPPGWSPSYTVGGDWMGWGQMVFVVNDFQPDINTWIDKNLAEYKNDLVVKENTKIDDKPTFLINTKENYQGMFTARNVILGNKYSYTIGRSQDGENDFGERLEKEIYPTIHID